MQRTLSIGVFLLLWPIMATGQSITLDAVTIDETEAVNPTVSHTAGVSPEAVLCFVAQEQSFADEDLSMTYGGVSMTEVALSPAVFDGGEDMASYAFFLGASVPTGTQTGAVSGGDSASKVVTCLTLNAGNNGNTMVVEDTSVYQGVCSTGDTTYTISLHEITSYVSELVMSGVNQDDNPDLIAPLAGWTDRASHDHGPESSLVITYDTVGSNDVTAGVNHGGSSFDCAMLGVAISESVSATVTEGSMLLGVVQ